ncbi:hypothetical protein [Pseudonocardia sp.]|uniref:hypothetical protein n=1 Tax=Pseudonocardia sp. TaxID=60912 RepID=UPI003D11D2FA
MIASARGARASRRARTGLRHLAGAAVTAAVVGVLALTLAAAAGATVAPADSTPQGSVTSIPISPAGGLGQMNLSSSDYGIARRFVLPQDVTIDRWYFAVNGEGSECVGGRDGYGSGDGGTWLGSIVTVDPATGLPTDDVLASEQVNACVAYERAGREFGLSNRHQAQYVQFPPLALKADTLYAFVLRNVDSSPGDGGGDSVGNHMSPNLDVARLAEMGPNGRNTLDPRATGAVYGVDPRETTMWTGDAGQTWEFGSDIGWYRLGKDRGGWWPSGYRIAGGDNVAHGWAYMNWPDDESASVTLTAAADGVLVEAGGASDNENVGVITVENDQTGASGRTTDLGPGLVSGTLDHPVQVLRGQQYTVSNSGEVDIGSGDPWGRVFNTPEPGADASTCPDCAEPTDRPMLYASTINTETAAAPGAPGSGMASAMSTALVIGAVVAAAAGVATLLLLRRGRR